jgi:hypothetical protein
MGYVIKPMISGPTPSGTEWKPLLPPTYFLASIIVMVGLDILLPGARVLSFPLTLAGLAPMIVGGSIERRSRPRLQTQQDDRQTVRGLDQRRDRRRFQGLPQPDVSRNDPDPSRHCPSPRRANAFRRVCSVRPSHAGALRPGRRANAGRATWSGMATLQRTGSTLVLAAPAADRGHLDLRGIGRKPKLALPHRVRWNRPQR